MADYDWDFSEPPRVVACCNKCSDGGRQHERWCENSPPTIRELWLKGFEYAGDGMYRCERGCGCIVWNLEAHMENVCREWPRG